MKSLRIHIGIIALFCSGFFLIPNQSHACSKKPTKAEQSSCSAEQSKESAHKDCCKTESQEKNKHHNNCGDNCTHSTCTCSTPASSLSIAIGLKTKAHFIEAQKENFKNNQANFSSGFSSIWIPPKIG